MKQPSDKNIIWRIVLIIGMVALVGIAVASCAAQNQTRTQEQSQSMELTASDRQTFETAQRAYNAFVETLATGDEKPLVEMLTDDVRFQVPIPQFRGTQQGKAQVAAITRWRWDTFGLRLLSPAVLETTTASGDTVSFEFQTNGTVKGKPFDNHLVVIFVVRGDKISAFREYTNPEAGTTGPPLP